MHSGLRVRARLFAVDHTASTSVAEDHRRTWMLNAVAGSIRRACMLDAVGFTGTGAAWGYCDTCAGQISAPVVHSVLRL